MKQQFYKPQQERLIPKIDSQTIIRDIQKRTYWLPTQEVFEQRLIAIRQKKGISEKKSLVKIMDYLTEILQSSESDVVKMIKKRGKDLQQTKKTVAGNNYQALIAFGLNRNIINGNLPQDLKVVLKPKRHPLIEKYATIKVGQGTQKPDIDILIYQDKPKTPLVIYSCKTSLRERAGQTYKWKLLVDFASTRCKYIKNNSACPINRYKLDYKKDRQIYVAMITADLYNELRQPQQIGMFSFFDFAYTSRPAKVKVPKFVKSLSNIIKDLNKIYR